MLSPSFCFLQTKLNMVRILFCIAFCVSFAYTIRGREMIQMLFEWDDDKEKINIAKHGIDFSTAAHVFQDENRIEFFDEAHSEYEDRYITIGQISGIAIIVMVVYTERENAIRLISARKATNQERRMYYDCP